MRTEELIKVLAADTQPSPSGVPQRRLALAALAGGAAALLGTVFWLGLRGDLTDAVIGGGFFWAKAGYTGAIAAACALAALRLASPERQATGLLALVGAIVALMAGLGVWEYAMLAPAERISAIRGVSWTVCARNILVLALPMIALSLVVVRSLAPTRPTLAGLACGLFSGGLAATIYGLHCPEATLVFVSLWYTLGVALCGLLGAALGRFLLRW